MTSNQLKIDRYCEQNRECAEIILADAGRYGEESLMVRWARLVMPNPCAIAHKPQTEAEAA